MLFPFVPVISPGMLYLTDAEDCLGFLPTCALPTHSLVRTWTGTFILGRFGLFYLGLLPDPLHCKPSQTLGQPYIPWDLNTYSYPLLCPHLQEFLAVPQAVPMPQPGP